MNSCRNERGSIIVVTALSMVAIMGIMALGVDLGLVFLQRAVLARATDAAALAGVVELPQNAGAAEAKALEYGVRNGLLESEMSVDVVAANRDIEVTANRDVNLFFARILGRNTATVSAKAKAHIDVLIGTRGVVPFGIFDQQFVYGEQYMLKTGPQIGEGAYKGNFGPLALGGNGADVYETNIKYGYQSMMRVGDVIETETGNMPNATTNGVTYRVNHPQSAGCTFENPSWLCPRVVVVPVITPYSKGGRNKVTVVGFAALYLEATTRNGGDNYVVGRFLEMVAEGEGGDSTYYGLRTSRLVE